MMASGQFFLVPPFAYVKKFWPPFGFGVKFKKSWSPTLRSSKNSGPPLTQFYPVSCILSEKLHNAAKAANTAKAANAVKAVKNHILSKGAARLKLGGHEYPHVTLTEDFLVLHDYLYWCYTEVRVHHIADWLGKHQ